MFFASYYVASFCVAGTWYQVPGTRRVRIICTWPLTRAFCASARARARAMRARALYARARARARAVRTPLNGEGFTVTPQNSLLPQPPSASLCFFRSLLSARGTLILV